MKEIACGAYHVYLLDDISTVGVITTVKFQPYPIWQGGNNLFGCYLTQTISSRNVN